ncbi:MAG: 30S ribosomal protein S13 [Candidatus Micrarchaeota archaeon]|nr:30S ribosomal protein S13 [Candidatus Micrarchaeota archaeon]MDE1804479.1 30S ribosomal protein S13 [Candidatus Micrarchaeota archaeon]MDE1846632.1 30S ribosomal protein S13 [Candidatus Micrarchaeota archaeon]
MAEEKREKQQGHSPQQKSEQSIIRIAGKDINGSFAIPKALNQVKGLGMNISHSMALIIEREFQIPMGTEIGSLSDEQIEKVETVIKEPSKFGIPTYLLNRQRDKDTNTNMHLTGSDLIVRGKQDIEADIRVQSWRGFRHQYGQKVRGQRTRSTGRTGETIGVMKKSAQPAAAPAKEEKK